MTGLPITEKDLQRTVVEALQVRGYLVYHSWTSVHSAKGFPDIVAIHPIAGRGWAIECKGPNGKPTRQQWDWIRAFGEVVGIEAMVLWPDGLDDWLERLRRG